METMMVNKFILVGFVNEIKKMDEERRNFFEETKGLRQQVYQKRLALASELAKQNPDAAQAAVIIKEISDLKAQLRKMDHKIIVLFFFFILMTEGGQICQEISFKKAVQMALMNLGKNTVF